MTMPTAAVNTTNLDAGTDSRAAARPDLLDAVQKLNQIIDHIEPLGANLLDDTTTSQAQTTLGGTTVGKAVFTATDAAAARSALGVTGVILNYHQGFSVSNPGGSNNMTFGVGVCADSTNTTMITLSTSLAKNAKNAWSLGATGGTLDTGTLATDAWYYFYVILNTTTQVVDVVSSLSATTPSLPSGFTLFRFIFAARSNGSANFGEEFITSGDDVFFKTPLLAAPGALPNTTSGRLDNPAYVPTGIITRVHLIVSSTGGGASSLLYFSDPFSSDAAPTSTNFSQVSQTVTTTSGRQLSIRTNSSGQVRVRTTDTTLVPRYTTLGFNLAEAKGR